MKKKTPIKPMLNQTEIAPIADKARLKFDSGQYKEAIELYKQLLKHEDHKDWRQALKQCYLLRALSFAEKGMVKEAVVLWDNYAQYAEPPYQSYDCYVGWLLQINDNAKIKQCLSRLSASQLDENYPDLACLLGLLILTEKPELEAMLPIDSVFINHLALAREALSAYQDKNLEAVEHALKQLPFRSAFKDFRILLKAALSLSEPTVNVQLAKISVTSPYHQAAKLLLAMTHEGSVLVDDCLQFDHKQRRIIASVKKFSKKQTELLEFLVKQKDHLSDKLKFNCAIQYQELFGSDLARTYCQAALTTYQAGLSDFNKHFAKLSEFEQSRLKALHYEHERNYEDSDYYWKQCIGLLSKEDATDALKRALIMRHITKYQPTINDAIELLADSLKYDPNDRESYLVILKHYQDHRKTDIYKQWLDKAIGIFPKDIDILTRAIKSSIANKAYKKATQYALTILKADPVNTFAKQVLFSSHLAHARKLLKAEKFHLVEKEIQQAEKLTLGKRYQIQVDFLRGFFVLLAQDRKQGLQQIVDAMQKINEGEVVRYFCAIMEALLLKLNLAPLLKQWPQPAKKYLLSEQEIIDLTQLIRHYHDDNRDNLILLNQGLERIKAILKQTLKLNEYSEQTLLTLCQCLDSIESFELLAHCAKSVSSQGSKPIWVFYKIYAEAHGQAARCPSFNINQLEINLKLAKQQADQRTASLIEKFIGQYYAQHDLFGANSFDDFDEDDFDVSAPSSIELFEHLPQSLFYKIEKRMNELLNKNSPEHMHKILIQFLPRDANQKLLTDDPEVFFGILVLYAAHELGIDTQVTVDDVMNLGRDFDSIPF